MDALSTWAAGFLVRLGGLHPAGCRLALAVQLHVYIRQLDVRLRCLIPCQPSRGSDARGRVRLVGTVLGEEEVRTNK